MLLESQSINTLAKQILKTISLLFKAIFYSFISNLVFASNGFTPHLEVSVLQSVTSLLTTMTTQTSHHKQAKPIARKKPLQTMDTFVYNLVYIKT